MLGFKYNTPTIAEPIDTNKTPTAEPIDTNAPYISNYNIYDDPDKEPLIEALETYKKNDAYYADLKKKIKSIEKYLEKQKKHTNIGLENDLNVLKSKLKEIETKKET